MKTNPMYQHIHSDSWYLGDVTRGSIGGRLRGPDSERTATLQISDNLSN
jgi:hypothetical protein